MIEKTWNHVSHIAPEELLLDVGLRLLQEWRAIQALAEGSQAFVVGKQHAENLAHLKKYFHTKLSVGEAPTAPRLVAIDTHTPSSSVARIKRTLVLPHSQLDRCRSMWVETPRLMFGFAGLDHRARSATLNSWQSRVFGEHVEPIHLHRGQDLGVADGQREVAIVFSEHGRGFPQKIWDESYFRFLADTKLTLCPDGEEGWTFRFFEAMLCGSMPVVESHSPAYEGFRYRFMSETGPDAGVSRDDLEANFKLCRERLTIPLDALDIAVAQMLRSKTRRSRA